MNVKKICLALCLAASCGLTEAQTNAPAKKATEQLLEIDSDSGYFDGNKQQMIYLGNVFVTDYMRAKMTCGQLTIYLPPNGGHPTNIVAETEVVIDLLDEKGQTTHITADKAIYAYSIVTNLVNVVTNETVTFTGGNPSPKAEGPQFVIWGEPLILDVPTKRFGGSHYKSIFKQAATANGQTNASPFQFTK